MWPATQPVQQSQLDMFIQVYVVFPLEISELIEMVFLNQACASL